MPPPTAQPKDNGATGACPVCAAVLGVFIAAASLAAELDPRADPLATPAARRMAQSWAATYREVRARCRP